MEKIVSSCIYLSSFGVILLLIRLAEKNYTYKKYNKIYEKICLIVAVIIACLIAGLRADSVGVDTKSVSVIMNYARRYNSIFNFTIGTDIGEYELFYAILAFICSRISISPIIMLFVIQALTIIPIIIAGIKLRDKTSLTMIMAIYLFCFYNNSLNIMRQSIACSFILLGVVYYLNKEDDNAIIRNMVVACCCFLTAMFFHKSAILGIFAIIALVLVSKLQIRKFSQIVVYVLVVMSPVFIRNIMLFFNHLGIMNSAFLYYYNMFIDKTIQTNKFVNPFSYYCTVDVILRLLLFITPCIFLLKKKLSKEMIFIRMTCFTGFIFFTTILYSMNTNYGQRISLFFDYFLILFIPMSITKPNKRIKRYITISLIVLYWFVWIIKFGWSGSEIYVFRNIY